MLDKGVTHFQGGTKQTTQGFRKLKLRQVKETEGKAVLRCPRQGKMPGRGAPSPNPASLSAGAYFSLARVLSPTQT